MESASTENVLYIALAAVAVIVMLVMFIQGWMMKLAVRICGGNEIGIFYGVSALTLSSMAGAAASITTAVVMPGINPLLAVIASVLGSVALLCLMLQMGPIRAFAVYLTQGLLSLVAVSALVAIGVAGVYLFVPPDSLQQFADNAKTQIGNVNPAVFSGTQTDLDGEGNEQSLGELTKLLGGLQTSTLEQGSEEGANISQQQFDAKTLQNAIGQALFSGGTNNTVDEGKTITDSQQQKESFQPSKTQVKTPPIQSPYDSKIRANPFVK